MQSNRTISFKQPDCKDISILFLQKPSNPLIKTAFVECIKQFLKK